VAALPADEDAACSSRPGRTATATSPAAPATSTRRWPSSSRRPLPLTRTHQFRHTVATDVANAGVLRADHGSRDAGRLSIQSSYTTLVDEHGTTAVSYSTLRDYVRRHLGRGRGTEPAGTTPVPDDWLGRHAMPRAQWSVVACRLQVCVGRRTASLPYQAPASWPLVVGAPPAAGRAALARFRDGSSGVGG
jgi:hypothetical protein